MNEKDIIRETLDDTLEGLYYKLTMRTDLSTDEIKALIIEVLGEMGYGNGGL